MAATQGPLERGEGLLPAHVQCHEGEGSVNAQTLLDRMGCADEALLVDAWLPGEASSCSPCMLDPLPAMSS